MSRPALTARLALAGLVAGAAWPPDPVRAETVECRLTPACTRGGACPDAAITLDFAIDRSQLAPALDPAEPPRRSRITVRLNDHRFPAEPIVMRNGAKGFWAEDDGQTRMLIVQPGGGAVFTDGSVERSYEGRCRDVR